MRRNVLLSIALAAVGCAGAQKPMTEGAAQALKGKRAAAVAHKRPDFSAMTAGKAAFGIFGAAAMISAGNGLVEKHGIEDPAVKMSADLVAALRDKLGVTASATTGIVEDGDIEALAARYPDEDLLLTVQTVNWSFTYFPTDWSHYRVIYSVKARLIDLKTKQVLAEGLAKRVPDRTPDSPTYDELLASDAARLKAELQKAADECYQELLRNTFKL